MRPIICSPWASEFKVPNNAVTGKVVQSRLASPMRDDNTCLPVIEMTEFVLAGVG